jgi:hypothetical protein
MLIYESIPPSSTVPLIVIYLTGVMSLTTISIIFTVILSRIHWASFYSPMMSRKFYLFMTRKIASVLGMTSIVERYETIKIDAYQHSLNRLSIDKHELENRRSNSITYKQNAGRRISKFFLSISKIKDVKKEKENINVINEWKLIAFILDRFFFYVMFMISFCSTFYLFVIYPLFKPIDNFK